MICKKCETECDVHAGKALCWLKFFFISLVASVAIAWIACLFIDPELRRGFEDFCARWLVAAIAFPFYLPFIIPPLFAVISLCIAIFNCSKWLIHAEKELNRVSEAKFVPWEDVSSALILPLFPFIHFFILKELLTRQKETLDRNNLESETPPQWALPGILGGGIAAYASFFLILDNRSPALSHISIGCFIAFLILLFASYIKIIRTITANTSTLYSLPDAVFTADSPTDIQLTDAPDDTAASTEPDNGTQEQNSDNDRAEASIICKETAPVNSDSQPQDFLDKDFQENVLRGEKLIDRSKKAISIMLKTDIFIFFIFIIGFNLNSNFLVGLCFFAYPILSLLIFFMLFSAVSIYCKWLYHILRNLRKFTGTRFSPKIAVACSLLLGIGQLLTCFIFKDILTHQKEVLDTHRTDTSSIPTSTPVSPLLLGSLIIFIIFKIITLETVKEIAGFVAFMAFFFPIIPYLFIFKVAFDIFAIIILLIYMNLVQQPILNEKAIAQLNIGNIKATNPDKEINPEINGSPAENDEIPQDNP